MKDFLKQILQDIENPLLARCVIREYLQARLLQSLQGKGVFSAWVFQGGTALRFLYAMPRFSEDLDFALVKPGLSDNFREVLKNVKDVFQSENYDITVKVSDAKTVKSAFIRYAGLLFELGVSPHRSEVISVKVELDTNSPLGAGITSTVVRRYVTLNLRHHDKASLLAGKLHAVLTRRYVKGRDIYDLIWYLSDTSWPDPNIELLNNALGQTNWPGPKVTMDNWRELVRHRIETFNWKLVSKDVSPFLERTEDVALLTKENVLKLLRM